MSTATMETDCHDIATLPKWAQLHIKSLELKAESAKSKLETLEKMQAITCEPQRDWFTLPFSHDGNKPIHLWLLNLDYPYPVCALGKGDLLFVGRAKKNT